VKSLRIPTYNFHTTIMYINCLIIWLFFYLTYLFLLRILIIINKFDFLLKHLRLWSSLRNLNCDTLICIHSMSVFQRRKLICMYLCTTIIWNFVKSLNRIKIHNSIIKWTSHLILSNFLNFLSYLSDILTF